MPHVLMIVGAFLVIVGIGGVAAGAPDWLLGLSLGATLVQSGMIALVGGLVLIGLSQVLRTLEQLLDRLNAPAPAFPARPAPPREMLIAQPGPPAQPARHAPVEEVPPPDEPSELPDEPPLRPRREREFPGGEPARARREAPGGFSSDAAKRARRESPPASDGDEPTRPRRDTHERYGDEPSRLRRDSSPEVAGEEPGHPREAKPARQRREGPSPLPPLPLPFDERRRSRNAAESPEMPAPRFRPVETPPPEAAPAEATVVRSGVIGGMAYTLYSDGSIEAELPIGTVRFGSIAELQDHVMRTGTEADVDFTESSR